MTRRHPRDLRPDEQLLWEQVKKNTVPLHRPVKKILTEAIEQIAPHPARIDIPMFRIGQNVNYSGLNRRNAQSTPVRMDSKNLDRLKKGKLSPEARIDLHGMTLAVAHPALIGFLLNAHTNGFRLVLVITGKGRTASATHPEIAQKGVLRHQVPAWLSQAPVNSVVQYVSDAHGRHGGGGALYVYLRRAR